MYDKIFYFFKALTLMNNYYYIMYIYYKYIIHIFHFFKKFNFKIIYLL